MDTQHQSSTQESDGWLRKACEGWKGEKIKKRGRSEGRDGNRAGGVRGGKMTGIVRR